MNGSGSSSANPSHVRGICPEGWHVPSLAEWEALNVNEFQCDGDIAKAMASNADWQTGESDPCSPGYDLSENNASGLSVVPAGYHDWEYGFYFITERSYFWTTTLDDDNNIYYIKFSSADGYSPAALDRVTGDCGMSVRCVRDE